MDSAKRTNVILIVAIVISLLNGALSFKLQSDLDAARAEKADAESVLAEFATACVAGTPLLTPQGDVIYCKAVIKSAPKVGS